MNIKSISSYLLLSAIVTLPLACDSSSSSQKNPPQPEAPVVLPQLTPTPDADPSPAPTPGPEVPGAGDGRGSTQPGPTQPQPGLRDGLSISSIDFLQRTGDAVAVKASSFQQASGALQQSLLTFCAQTSLENQQAAQNAWKDVMRQWQSFELLQVGPLAADQKALKEQIYSWPSAANLCKVDEEALNALADPEYALPSQGNRKGLLAFEYLLFESSLKSSCSNANAVSAQWNAQSDEGKWSARCAYLKPLALELLSNAQSLQVSWGTPGNNVLSRAAADPAAAKASLQELFTQLFYMDLEVKNSKLGAPAGHDASLCSKYPAPCPEKAELRYSQFSADALRVNIASFMDLIFGFPDAQQLRHGGFSALVRQSGAPEAAAKSEVNARSLAEFLKSDGLDLNQLIVQQGQENCELSAQTWLCRLRVSLKQTAADLRQEYAAILQLQVPQPPQGDND